MASVTIHTTQNVSIDYELAKTGTRIGSFLIDLIILIIINFILATTMTPASVNDTNYLPYCTLYSRHTKQPIEKVYADKGYAGAPNRQFLAGNEIADGIMRKDTTTAKLYPVK